MTEHPATRGEMAPHRGEGLPHARGASRADTPPDASETARVGGLLDSPWVAVVAILISGLIVYANSFRGQYPFDDFVSIVSNPNIRHLGDIGKIVEAPRDHCGGSSIRAIARTRARA